jgi:polyisoprenoid-binding protein YceI
VEGDLTIRGITRPVTLELEYLGWSDDPWGGKRAGFSAATEIDRHDFGANWNVAVETGGVVVGRKVRIELEIEAALQAD